MSHGNQKYNKETIEKAIALYKQGKHSYNDIVKLFRLGSTTVLRYWINAKSRERIKQSQEKWREKNREKNLKKMREYKRSKKITKGFTLTSKNVRRVLKKTVKTLKALDKIQTPYAK